MADVIGPIPFIYNLLKENINPTEGLKRYRELGGAIRTQRFYAAYGEVAAEVAVFPRLQALGLKAIPGRELIPKRATRSEPGYLARVGVLVSTRIVDPLTGRVSEVTQTNWGSVRMKQLQSIEAILAAGEEKFGPEGQSGVALSTVIGSILGPVTELVPVTE